MGSQDHRGLWTHGTYQVGAKRSEELERDVGKGQGKFRDLGESEGGRKERVVHVYLCVFVFFSLNLFLFPKCIIVYFCFISLLLSPQP